MPGFCKLRALLQGKDRAVTKLGKAIKYGFGRLNV